MAGSQVTAVVPTLGLSPLLEPCLERLRSETGVRIVVVHQGEGTLELPDRLTDELLETKSNLGFTGGTNLGIQRSRSPFVATVNDDVLVEPGWTSELVAALEAEDGIACAQGVNCGPAAHRADGQGLGWNRFWQAVQLAHGQAPLSPAAPCQEVFGVSATAAVYRRQSLLEVATRGEVFDTRLGSYYEDVDLAWRLRAAGFRALLVPRARAQHAGSTTGRQMPRARLQSLYGNRYLVLAGLLGRAFWPRLPVMLLRDGVDVGRAALRGDLATAGSVFLGLGRAARNLRRFCHLSAPRVPLPELRRFRG